MHEPLEAGREFLPDSAPTDPTAPGPFAFADAGRIRSILDGAGFRDVAIRPFDMRIGGRTVEQSLAIALRVGPLGMALRENPQCREQLTDAVRVVLERYLTAQGVLMPASVWIVSARPG